MIGQGFHQQRLVIGQLWKLGVVLFVNFSLDLVKLNVSAVSDAGVVDRHRQRADQNHDNHQQRPVRNGCLQPKPIRKT
ncbi:hypothetical protein D3C78_1623610 [compost metagenome]